MAMSRDVNEQMNTLTYSAIQAIKVTDFNFIKVLGKGSFGKVRTRRKKRKQMTTRTISSMEKT
jgi:hypothetical protein